MQVARRVRAHEQVSDGEQATGKRRAVRYQTCNRDDFVFLHPRSSLHSTAPEFVVYTLLIRTAKRAYMSGWFSLWMYELVFACCCWHKMGPICAMGTVPHSPHRPPPPFWACMLALCT